MTHVSKLNAILTDDDIAAILRSDEPGHVLSARYGVSVNNVNATRRRETKASLRVAVALGLLPSGGPVRGWLPRGGVDVGVPSSDTRSGR